MKREEVAQRMCLNATGILRQESDLCRFGRLEKQQIVSSSPGEGLGGGCGLVVMVSIGFCLASLLLNLMLCMRATSVLREVFAATAGRAKSCVQQRIGHHNENTQLPVCCFSPIDGCWAELCQQADIDIGCGAWFGVNAV